MSQEKIHRLAARRDGNWQNSLTGLGIAGLDKSRGVRYVKSCELGAQELADVYRSNWLARKLVEALPQRALAQGFAEHTPMPPQFEELNYAQWDEGALQRAIYLGRNFGGAHLFVGYADGGEDASLPVTKKGNVAFLDVFTRHELAPDTVGGQEARDPNPLSPTAGQVTVWKVIGDHPRRGLRYHVSRAIKFGGLSLPPMVSPGQAAPTPTGAPGLGGFDPYYRDWSDSVLKPVWEDVQRYGVFWQSVAHLLGVASVGVLKIAGLFEALHQNNGERMRARVDLQNQMLSLTRNLLLDAERNEGFERSAASFADIPALLDQMMIATAGAFGMPATELFGRAPQGMNATGESDQKMWEAQVTEWRRRVLTPRVNALAEAISGQPSKIEYPEVHIATELEQMDLRLKRSQGNERLWAMGAFSDQEIRDAEREGVLPEQLPGLAKEVPPDPTRAVVQVSSATKVETEGEGGAPFGNEKE
jgi:phage-related protein (TIGR01555 family)